MITPCEAGSIKLVLLYKGELPLEKLFIYASSFWENCIFLRRVYWDFMTKNCRLSVYVSFCKNLHNGFCENAKKVADFCPNFGIFCRNISKNWLIALAKNWPKCIHTFLVVFGSDACNYIISNYLYTWSTQQYACLNLVHGYFEHQKCPRIFYTYVFSLAPFLFSKSHDVTGFYNNVCIMLSTQTICVLNFCSWSFCTQKC